MDCVVLTALQAALGQETKAIKKLLSLVNHEDLGVCIRALGVLGDLGNTNSLVINELLSLLHNKDLQQLKHIIVGVLGDLRSVNSVVITSLLLLLDDRDSFVSHTAAEALHKFGNSSPKVIETMAIISQIDELTISEYVPPVSVLDGIKTEEELQKIVNKCLVSLDDKDLYVQIQSIELLDELARSGTEFVSKLLSQLSDENLNRLLDWLSVPSSNASVSVSAKSILTHLAKNSDKISPRVVQWLEQNPNDDGIGYVIDCLWSIVVE